MSAFSSAFSSVDDADDPERLVAYLGRHAAERPAMRRYIVQTLLDLAHPGPILDLGCGAGHDLALLDDVGLTSVGIDPSAVMVAAARATGAALVRGDGTALPFAAGAFAGCWIERVLMHTTDPSAVLGEVVRCLRPGGALTVFEPDWSSLTTTVGPLPTGWSPPARQPAIGRTVGPLLAAAGCTIHDRVEERSWWTLDALVRNTRMDRSHDPEVNAWLADRRRDGRRGTFRAEMVKVLWVATAPG